MITSAPELETGWPSECAKETLAEAMVREVCSGGYRQGTAQKSLECKQKACEVEDLYRVPLNAFCWLEL